MEAVTSEEVETANPIRLLEIEKELAGPEAEAAMLRYDGRLEALDGRLRTALASGLPRESYADVEALKGAVEVARKILRLTVKKG